MSTTQAEHIASTSQGQAPRDQDRDHWMSSGEEELLAMIQSGLHTEIIARQNEKLFHKDYLSEGWTILDAFFVQVGLQLFHH